MDTMHPTIEALAPIIGIWQSSGSVFDTTGNATAEIRGTDSYAVNSDQPWIRHDVDVDMGGTRVKAVELIGGRHPEGGWHMVAFDENEHPGFMRLSEYEPGLLLLSGSEVRSWFSVAAGPNRMTTRWERRIDDRWVRWMDMRFDRQSPTRTSKAEHDSANLYG